ncbi:MAG: hypothetical protein ABGW69_01965 [Nanoarchaeota archaeon]
MSFKNKFKLLNLLHKLAESFFLLFLLKLISLNFVIAITSIDLTNSSSITTTITSNNDSLIIVEPYTSTLIAKQTTTQTIQEQKNLTNLTNSNMLTNNSSTNSSNYSDINDSLVNQVGFQLITSDINNLDNIKNYQVVSKIEQEINKKTDNLRKESKKLIKKAKSELYKENGLSKSTKTKIIELIKELLIIKLTMLKIDLITTNIKLLNYCDEYIFTLNESKAKMCSNSRKTINYYFYKINKLISELKRPDISIRGVIKIYREYIKLKKEIEKLKNSLN